MQHFLLFMLLASFSCVVILKKWANKRCKALHKAQGKESLFVIIYALLATFSTRWRIQ